MADDSESDEEVRAFKAQARSGAGRERKPSAVAAAAAVDAAIAGKRKGGAVDLDALLKNAAKRSAAREKEEEAERAWRESLDAAPTAPPAADDPTAAAGAGAALASPTTGASGGEAPEEALLPSLFRRPPSVPAPAPLVCKPDPGDPLLALLRGKPLESAGVAEVVQGGWVAAHYAAGAKRRCPPELTRWLFELASYHAQPAFAAAAGRALAAVFDAGADAAAPDGSAFAAAVTPQHFVAALCAYGAVESELVAAPNAAAAAAAETQAADGGSQGGGAAALDGGGDVRRRLVGLLELAARCAKRWGALPPAEAGGAAAGLGRLLLEPHAAPSFLSLQDAIANLLDAAPDAGGAVVKPAPVVRLGWSHAVLPACTAALAALAGRLPHESIARLCLWLPPTARGTELQVRVALAGIGVLLRRRQPPAAAAAATAEAGTEEDGASQAAASQAAGEEDEPHIEEDEDDDEEDGEEAAAAAAAEEVETAASAVANALAGPAESHDLSARDLTSGGARVRAVRACALVRAVDVGRWVAQMPSLLSLVRLLDAAISCDAAELRAAAEGDGGARAVVKALKAAVGRLRNVVQKKKRHLDYHALEVEQALAVVDGKIQHCVLPHDA